MYTLLRNASWREGALVEAPAALLSLGVAEAFYKFHSFTLECLAFLATWLAVSYAIQGVRALTAATRRKPA